MYITFVQSAATLLLLLCSGMLTGSDIRFEAPVSKQLYDGLTGTLIPALAKGGFRAIRLEGEVTSERVETQGGVVSGLSYGAVFEMLDNGKCIALDRDSEIQELITDNYGLVKKLAKSVEYQYLLNMNYTVFTF